MLCMKDAGGKVLGKKQGRWVPNIPGEGDARGIPAGMETWRCSCWCPDSLPKLDLGLAFISGFVVELRGVQSIELSTRHAVDVVRLSGRALGMHRE